MANKYLDTAFVDKAMRFAIDAHRDTERRGKGFPYIIHPMEAVSIVATISNDPELLAAAALHDTVEDTAVTEEQIRAEFGDRVANLVHAESDVLDPNLPEEETWRARKQAAIDRLSRASRDAKIVALGDKLSNMRAIERDYLEQGDALWSLFHAPGGKKDHAWHYHGLARALRDLSGTAAYTELLEKIMTVFGIPEPELIDMSDYEESGDGYMATSYNCKSDRTRMVKLYNESNPASLPEREFVLSWSIVQTGLRIPRVNRLVTDGKRIGVEFERITPKKSIARMISEDESILESLTLKFASFCKDLHSRRCDLTKFESVSDFFKAQVCISSELDHDRKIEFLRFIDSVPVQNTCIHGDMHVGNMIFNPETEEYFWIDLSDFRYGNPLYDLGMFALVSKYIPEDLQKKLFHMGSKQMLRIWNTFLRGYYGPDADIEALDREIRPFAALHVIRLENIQPLPFLKDFLNNTILL